MAASLDKILNDDDSKTLIENIKNDFSSEKLGKLIDSIVEKAKGEDKEKEFSTDEIDELLGSTIGEDYIKKMVNKRIEQLIKGEETPVVELTEVEELRKKSNEYLNLARSTQAEFDNYRKRTIRENENFRKISTISLIERLLPVADSLDNAIEKDSEIGEKAIEGFKKIRKLLTGILTKEGLELIESVGEEFNPEFHEAILQVESDEYEVETVVEELRKGYKIGDRVVRAPMVKVAVPPAPPVVEEVITEDVQENQEEKVEETPEVKEEK
jgi:molecular chaperone GrpE